MGLTDLHDSQARVLAYYSLALTVALSKNPLHPEVIYARQSVSVKATASYDKIIKDKT